MNLVYLSPHFPAHFGLFVERLHDRGVRVFGITDQHDEALRPELRRALAAHYRVDSLNNLEQVMAACRYFTDHHGPIHHVESHLESWLEMEAEIRAAFKVPGKTPGDLEFARRKSKMKDVFRQAGCPVAKGDLVTDIAAARRFINGNFPAFIKPDGGVGAADTWTIRTDEDLVTFFNSKKDYPYFLEEYMAGVIESFDGLCDRDGEIVFFASHVFSNDIHKVVQKNENLYYYSQRVIPEDLEKHGRSVVKALGISAKFFHIEFFREPGGELKALEINLRVPGGLTSDMFNWACDIDVYDWWAEIVAGGPSKRSYERKFHCAFVARKHDRRYTTSDEELPQKLGERLVLTLRMSPNDWPVMGDIGRLVRAPDLERLMPAIKTIIEEAK